MTDTAPRREQLMTTSRETIGDAVLLTVHGEIDELTVARFSSELRAALMEARGPAIVDLTEVTVLAATGLEALVTAQRTAASLREPLRIVVDSQRPVIRPLELTGLDEVLSLYHDVAGAVASRRPDDQDVR